ncbi:MAG: TetR/AcrR family transcriptional regulator [Pseudoclavibacter sp.]
MVDAGDGRPRARRGRRPAGEVRSEVLEATAELLYAEGLRAVTFDRVAAKSGASKTTIYKWWSTPGALAAEAHFARSEPELVFVDTGDLRADVTTQLTSFVRLLTERGGGRVIAELIGAAQFDSDLAASVSERYTSPRRQLAVEYFRRALERGQLRADVDLELLVDQLWGACYNRLLVPDAPLDERFARALVTNTLSGAASTDYRGGA